MPKAPTKAKRRPGFLRRAIQWLLIAAVLLWLLAALVLTATRWIDPPTTAVHIERRFQAWIQQQALSRTLQIHSAQPNLARSPARRHRRRGRALLPAPRIRLARSPNRRPAGFRRRAHSRSLHHHPATRKEPVLRNQPLVSPQGCGGHPGPGRRIRPRQTAHSGALPQRGRMGPRYLRRRVGMPLLGRNSSPQYRPATGGTASGHPPRSTQTPTRPHE